MRRQSVACERQDRLGRREVTFTAPQRKYKRPVLRDRAAELSKRRIRLWHETLEAIWQNTGIVILPEVKAMNLVRKYELKIEHEELKLRGAF